MSRYTPNLNLFCVDPIADGSNTFNITTMLNNNWDAIDIAMAARAKLDGSTPFSKSITVLDGWVVLKGSTDRILEFQNPLGEREGFVGRVSSGSYVGINNNKSVKSLQLFDDGSLKYAGAEVLTTANHHTYTAVASDGHVKMEGDLAFSQGTANLGVRFLKQGRTGDSYIYWNATDASDNGLEFLVDGKKAFTLKSDGTGYLHEGGQSRKIFHDANHHTYSPVNKAGDTMTGDLQLQNGDSSVLLKFGKSGRPGKLSYIFWNANATSENGLTFVVDGNYAMKILSNGDLYSMQGASTIYKVFNEGNHHSYVPVNKAGDTMTGDLKIYGNLELNSSNNKLLEFRDGGTRNGYVGRILDTGGNYIALANLVSGKMIQLLDSGGLKYSGYDIFHSGNHHTYSPVNKTGDVMTGRLRIKTSDDAPLILQQEEGGVVGSVEPGWNYIVFEDSQSDRMGYIGFDASGNTMLSNSYENGKLYFAHLGSNYEVYHTKNHHTYVPLALDGSTAMTGDLLLKNGNSNVGLRFGKTGRTRSSFIYWNASDLVDFGMNFVVDGILALNLNSNGSAYLYQGGTATTQGTPKAIHHDGNHHTYTPLPLNGSIPMSGDLVINDKHIRIIAPTYNCGYSRGLFLSDETNTAIFGFGLYGDVSNGVNTFNYAYIGNSYSEPVVKFHTSKITEFAGIIRTMGSSLQLWGASSANDVELIGFSEYTTRSTFALKGDFLGEGATGNIIKFVSEWGNTIMSWRGDGNVGIGTANPYAPLHIKPTQVTGIQNGIILEDYGSGANEGLRIAWRVNDHAGVDLAAIEGGSFSTGGVLKLLVNGADTGTPTEKIKIEPSQVSITADLKVTGKITSNGYPCIAATYHQRTAPVSVMNGTTARYNLNISGDKNIILVNAKSTGSSANVVLNGYTNEKVVSNVFCYLEKEKVTDEWSIVIVNSTLNSVSMTWTVLELA